MTFARGDGNSIKHNNLWTWLLKGKLVEKWLDQQIEA